MNLDGCSKPKELLFLSNEYMYSPNAVGYVIGPPRKTDSYSSEELLFMGYVAVYILVDTETIVRLRNEIKSRKKEL